VFLKSWEDAGGRKLQTLDHFGACLRVSLKSLCTEHSSRRLSLWVIGEEPFAGCCAHAVAVSVISEWAFVS
jgi:hypothetical protein